jgi:hypothetical protein
LTGMSTRARKQQLFVKIIDLLQKNGGEIPFPLKRYRYLAFEAVPYLGTTTLAKNQQGVWQHSRVLNSHLEHELFVANVADSAGQ